MARPLVSESPSPKSTECAFWRGKTAKSLFCSPLLLSPRLIPRPRIFGAREFRAQYSGGTFGVGIRIGANSVLEPGARNEIGMGIGRTRENWGFGAHELFGSRKKNWYSERTKKSAARRNIWGGIFGRKDWRKYLVCVRLARENWYSVPGGREKSASVSGGRAQIRISAAETFRGRLKRWRSEHARNSVADKNIWA